MTDTVQLGDITLEEFEIPSEIRLGSEQSISRKRFVGNKHALDVMGSDPKPIEWAGAIRGPEALARAQALDAMCVAGREVAFTWSALSYTVIIADFEFRPNSVREVPYRIALEVVRNEAAPPTATDASPTTMIKGDLSTADQLAELLGEIELQEQVELASEAAAGVPNFVTAPTDALRSILRPVVSAQGIAANLIASAEVTLSAVTAVGGVLPGMRGRDLSAGLLRQVYAMDDAANLYDIENVLGRVELNLGAVTTAGASLVMGGSDLFRVAQQAYGDPAEWATIARANGLTDPIIAGVGEIVIPATPRDTGGVLR